MSSGQTDALRSQRAEKVCLHLLLSLSPHFSAAISEAGANSLLRLDNNLTLPTCDSFRQSGRCLFIFISFKGGADSFRSSML